MSSDLTLAVLDEEVQIAEALWAEEIAEGAGLPDDDKLVSIRGKQHSKLGLYDEYLYGDEARQIARIIFQLKAVPIETAEQMEALIQRHNDSVQEDADDPEYSKRTGVNRDRLLQARMITTQQREIMIGAVLRYGAGVLHRSGYTRLLARHTNQNRVNDTLDILHEAGFLQRIEGASNSDIFISDGRLEAAHRHYLERLSNAIQPPS